MADGLTMPYIARIHTAFATKFGVPRQSGLVPQLRAEIVFEPAYRNPDALRGLEGFSHLWLLWRRMVSSLLLRLVLLFVLTSSSW